MSNKKLINELTILASYYNKIGDRWRNRAYQSAIYSIKNLSLPITNIKQLKNVRGIGQSITNKIEEYLTTGYIKKADEIKKLKSSLNTTEVFEKIWGVGKVKASNLYKDGMRSISDIKANTHLLTRNQKIGLKYYKELQLPISKNYIDMFSLVIAYILSETFGGGTYLMDIAGSYRRGSSSSGDIDCLLSSTKFTLKEAVNALSKYNVIIDTLSIKNEKFMGIAGCPNKGHPFRLDIEFLPAISYGSGLLYFTGSKFFNIKMRAKAKSMGYTLNEKGLYNKRGTRLKFYSEEEIMNALDMEYVNPTLR